jgi:hypothetical protein
VPVLEFVPIPGKQAMHTHTHGGGGGGGGGGSDHCSLTFVFIYSAIKKAYPGLLYN